MNQFYIELINYSRENVHCSNIKYPNEIMHSILEALEIPGKAKGFDVGSNLRPLIVLFILKRYL